MVHVTGKGTHLSIEECFQLVESMGHWVCIHEKEHNSIACHPKFQKLINEPHREMYVESWLSSFHIQDRSILRLILNHKQQAPKNEVTVRLLINGEEPQWIQLKIVELSDELTCLIGKSLQTEEIRTIPKATLTEPFVSNNVDHLMTWLSLIDNQMSTTEENTSKENAYPSTTKSGSDSLYKRVKDIVERIPHGFAVISQEWEIIYINPTLEDIIGKSLKDIYKKNYWDVYPIDLYHNYFIQFTKALETKQVVQFQDYLYDVGKIIEVTAYPSDNELTLFVQDITQSKSYVEALRETEERFSLLAENVNEAFWIGSSSFHDYDYISPSFERIFGISITDLMKNPSVWLQYIHEDDRQKVLEGYKRMRMDKIAVEFRFKVPSGQMKWIRTKGYPLHRMGKTIVVGVHEDITEIKEKEVLQSKSEQYETVVRVAAGIAHEIRNPLTSIKGFLQLMLSNESGENQYSEIIFSELARIETIVNEFMLLAKPESEKALVDTDVVEIVQYSLSLFHHQIKQQNVQVEMVIDSDIPDIKSDSKRLNQVFINLVKNSLEAMEDGGELLVSGCFNQDEQNLVFKIQDSGKGIGKEQLERIGEPFFTTKEKGTGLGIMVTTKFVESLGGTLHYDSEVGKGTTATVTLPKYTR
ncbi:PAS domain S-box protein [Pontibacillus yanchengensis]|uniref:PAS domain S-box protein n=1 Tax=Pontibacillus yanchengensis TaxID=462910 RepID=A0ACC7VJ56_9BACI|nr:PAS domain S-box protein [Pontibacillus yanchengensis]